LRSNEQTEASEGTQIFNLGISSNRLDFGHIKITKFTNAIIQFQFDKKRKK